MSNPKIYRKHISEPCFRSYLNHEGLDKSLPSISSIDDGLKIYHIYYTLQDEKKRCYSFKIENGK